MKFDCLNFAFDFLGNSKVIKSLYTASNIFQTNVLHLIVLYYLVILAVNCDSFFVFSEKQVDIYQAMPKTVVLLPKYVSDSFYASITQIYIDMFKVSQTSNLWTTSSMIKTVTNKNKFLSLQRPKKQQKLIETSVHRSDTHLNRCVETFEKNHKYRTTWYLGKTRLIGDSTNVELARKL